MIGYVYVLCSCKSGRFYCGSTSNPPRRLAQHNSGVVAATRGKGPWQIVKLYEFADVKNARRAEFHIKRQKSIFVMQALAAAVYQWPPQFEGDVKLVNNPAVVSDCTSTGGQDTPA